MEFVPQAFGVDASAGCAIQTSRCGDRLKTATACCAASRRTVFSVLESASAFGVLAFMRAGGGGSSSVAIRRRVRVSITAIDRAAGRDEERRLSSPDRPLRTDVARQPPLLRSAVFRLEAGRKTDTVDPPHADT